MPTFIKSGYWEKKARSFKGWLNLDDLISDVITTTPTTTSLPFDNNISRDSYLYFSQSSTSDTIGDWRQHGDDNGFYVEYCTVGNATKGGGTWVNKFTIQV